MWPYAEVPVLIHVAISADSAPVLRKGVPGGRVGMAVEGAAVVGLAVTGAAAGALVGLDVGAAVGALVGLDV